MVGFGTVDMMRNASRQKKAETAAAKTPASTNVDTAPMTEKPVTNTSGTAGPKSTAPKQMLKQIEFGAGMAGGMGAMAGFLGMPFTKNVKGTAMVVDPLNQQVVGFGSNVKAPRVLPLEALQLTLRLRSRLLLLVQVSMPRLPTRGGGHLVLTLPLVFSRHRWGFLSKKPLASRRGSVNARTRTSS